MEVTRKEFEILVGYVMEYVDEDTSMKEIAKQCYLIADMYKIDREDADMLKHLVFEKVMGLDEEER